jgi:hypothetical protein
MNGARNVSTTMNTLDKKFRHMSNLEDVCQLCLRAQNVSLESFFARYVLTYSLFAWGLETEIDKHSFFVEKKSLIGFCDREKTLRGYKSNRALFDLVQAPRDNLIKREQRKVNISILLKTSGAACAAVVL